MGKLDVRHTGQYKIDGRRYLQIEYSDHDSGDILKKCYFLMSGERKEIYSLPNFKSSKIKDRVFQCADYTRFRYLYEQDLLIEEAGYVLEPIPDKYREGITWFA